LDNYLGGAVVLLVLAWAAYGLRGYVRLVLRLNSEGGRVQAQGFVLADLLMGLVLASYFGMLVVVNWPAHRAVPSQIKIEQVLPGQLMLLLIALGVAGFLIYRGANLVALLGLKAVPPRRVAIDAIMLLAGAIPIIFVVNFFIVYGLSQRGEEQQLVQLFRDEVRRGHYSGIATIVISGAVIAPCIEEFLFRGFFYGIFKRHFGALAGAVANAALFAAFHMNPASLVPLFILALCLTIAYEWSGSLFVPITMHALFNLANLGLLYFQAQMSPG